MRYASVCLVALFLAGCGHSSHGHASNASGSSVPPPPTTYTLTVQPGAHGTCNPLGGNYAPGTQVQLVATPDAGYKVDQWTGANINGNMAGNNNSVNMTSDKVVTVSFVPVSTI